MSQTTLQNLNTSQGRAAYRRYWYDLIVDQRNVLLPSLVRLWQTATTGKSFELASTGEGFQIVHPLGIRAGTRLFMEEVVVRHYFNNIQALVYLGAVLLLMSLGLRFAGLLSEKIALIGIGIEAIMLLMLFTVLFYTPEESSPTDDLQGEQQEGTEESTHTTIREVLEELEEIGGTYAALGMRMERLAQAQSEQIETLTSHVAQISGLQELANHSEGLAKMNDRLDRLVDAIDRMNHRIEILTGKEIEYRVRQELERRITPVVAPELDPEPRRDQSPS